MLNNTLIQKLSLVVISTEKLNRILYRKPNRNKMLFILQFFLFLLFHKRVEKFSSYESFLLHLSLYFSLFHHCYDVTTIKKIFLTCACAHWLPYLFRNSTQKLMNIYMYIVFSLWIFSYPIYFLCVAIYQIINELFSSGKYGKWNKRNS